MIGKKDFEKDYDVLDKHIEIMQTLSMRTEKEELTENDIKAMHDLLEIKSEFEDVHSKINSTDRSSPDDITNSCNLSHEFVKKLKVIVDKHYDNVCNNKKSFVGS